MSSIQKNEKKTEIDCGLGKNMMKCGLGVRNLKTAPINDVIVWNYRLNGLKSEKIVFPTTKVFLFLREEATVLEMYVICRQCNSV